MSKTTGIQARHGPTCPARDGRDCSCKPTYQANVWSAREKRRIFKTLPTHAAAKAWRGDALVALRKGTMRAPIATTLRQSADAWVAGAQGRKHSHTLRRPLQALGDPGL
jgi:integrase